MRRQQTRPATTTPTGLGATAKSSTRIYTCTPRHARGTHAQVLDVELRRERRLLHALVLGGLPLRGPRRVLPAGPPERRQLLLVVVLADTGWGGWGWEDRCVSGRGWMRVCVCMLGRPPRNPAAMRRAILLNGRRPACLRHARVGGDRTTTTGTSCMSHTPHFPFHPSNNNKHRPPTVDVRRALCLRE